jgi:hypothetical protein
MGSNMHENADPRIPVFRTTPLRTNTDILCHYEPQADLTGVRKEGQNGDCDSVRVMSRSTHPNFCHREIANTQQTPMPAVAATIVAGVGSQEANI